MQRYAPEKRRDLNDGVGVGWLPPDETVSPALACENIPPAWVIRQPIAEYDVVASMGCVFVFQRERHRVVRGSNFVFAIVAPRA